MVVPNPFSFLLAVFKSLTSVQEEPFQVSVFPVSGGVKPPKAIAAVFEAPAPVITLLAVF